MAEDTITAVVQVRGKLRAQLEVSASITLPPQDEGSRRLARHQESHQQLAVRHR